MICTIYQLFSHLCPIPFRAVQLKVQQIMLMQSLFPSSIFSQNLHENILTNKGMHHTDMQCKHQNRTTQFNSRIFYNISSFRQTIALFIITVKTYFHAISCSRCTHYMKISSTLAALGAGTMTLLADYTTLQSRKIEYI